MRPAAGNAGRRDQNETREIQTPQKSGRLYFARFVLIAAREAGWSHAAPFVPPLLRYSVLNA
jgi:hypothetical protein